MLSQTLANKGIDLVVHGALHAFSREASDQEIMKQRDVYEDRSDMSNILTEQQEIDRMHGEPFKASADKAADMARARLETGIRSRLVGAYQHYSAGNELECIRHILLALGSICSAIGWNKASSYLNDQNTVLFAIHKNEEEAREAAE